MGGLNVALLTHFCTFLALFTSKNLLHLLKSMPCILVRTEINPRYGLEPLSPIYVYITKTSILLALTR